MDIRQLSRVDLNLLLSLQVLLEECSVSRAAERLHITQPAMSKTLGRLRDTFEDPLLIRSSHGMRPTPKAYELEAPLRQVLESIDRLVSPSAFDPASYRGEFVIAATETLGVVLMGPLMELLAEEAPGIRIRTVTRVEKQLEQLAEGNLDFSIHLRYTTYSEDYRVLSLIHCKPVALVRPGHPLFGATIGWEKLIDYPFIDFYIPDQEDVAILQPELLPDIVAAQPRFAFDTSHLMTALEVVRRTDAILIIPSVVTLNPLVRSSVAMLPLPVEAGILEYMLVSHLRVAGSAPHRWLQEKIQAVVDTLEPGVGHM